MPLAIDPNPRLQAERLRADEIRRQQQQEIDIHVQAIKAARAEVEVKIRELQSHCDRLQHAARRLPPEDGGEARYRIYVTMHSRLVGAMGQALRRAQNGDRLLEVGRADQEEKQRRERENEVRDRVDAAVQHVFDLQLPRENDFEALFGEDLTHAS
jgi:hypothetical protein